MAAFRGGTFKDDTFKGDAFKSGTGAAIDAP